jgi:hypothetical protein
MIKQLHKIVKGLVLLYYKIVENYNFPVYFSRKTIQFFEFREIIFENSKNNFQCKPDFSIGDILRPNHNEVLYVYFIKV